MKVRCTKLLTPDGTPQQSSPWLTLGAIYDVLTVEFDRNGLWLVRLIGDSANEVALFPIDAFEIVSNRLAPSWVASQTERFFQLAPEAWLDAQFWERFYDRDAGAIETFETELARIKEAHEP